MFVCAACLFVPVLLQTSAAFESTLPTAEENASFETLIQASLSGCGASVLNQGDIIAHLQLLQNLTTLSVPHKDADWSWDDVCYRAPIGLLDGNGHFDLGYNDLVQQLNPCVIISLADCFWEGSKLAGPREHVNTDTRQGAVIRGLLYKNEQTGSWVLPDTLSWGNLNPSGAVERAQTSAQWVGGSISNELFQMIPRVENHLHAEGITTGYMAKHCLDETNCKRSTDSGKLTTFASTIGQISEHGCVGISSKYMRWNSTVVFEDMSLNGDGKIKPAKFLKSTLIFASPDEVLMRVRLQGNRWRDADAEYVLDTWKKAMRQYIRESLLNSRNKQMTNRYGTNV